MPLKALACLNGHTSEIFVHVAADTGVATRLCGTCGETLAPALSVGRALTFFEEGRPFTLVHGVPQPITITSHAQHQRVLKRYGLEPALDWHVSRKPSTRD